MAQRPIIRCLVVPVLGLSLSGLTPTQPPAKKGARRGKKEARPASRTPKGK